MAPGYHIFKGKLLFFLKSTFNLKYAKMGVLNYNTCFRMRSMSFLCIKCHTGNDITQSQLFKIQSKRTVME